jgi:hypothetical protein
VGAVTGVLVWLPTVLAGVLTAHTAVNALLLRRLPDAPPPVDEPVAVLLPVRDEAHQVGACLTALLAQRGVPGLSVLVLDDGSGDGTAEVVRGLGVQPLAGRPPPPGWLGKPWACRQLADAVPAGVGLLAFVDADVVLAPQALAAAVAVLRGQRFGLLSAYPRLLARSAGERLVQPLLPWSWLTFLPLRAMERSARPSLAAAGGQFLLVDRAAYERAGGHAAVAGRVLEDVELARAVKRTGGRIGLASAHRLAACRMYGSWAALRDGYGKSLWAAFPGTGAVGVPALLAVAYLGPLAVAPLAPLAGACGYALGVLGRVIAGRSTGGRTVPDALAHPLSVAVFGWLVARSHRLHRLGRLAWKGRALR